MHVSDSKHTSSILCLFFSEFSPALSDSLSFSDSEESHLGKGTPHPLPSFAFIRPIIDTLWSGTYRVPDPPFNKASSRRATACCSSIKFTCLIFVVKVMMMMHVMDLEEENLFDPTKWCHWYYTVLYELGRGRHKYLRQQKHW